MIPPITGPRGTFRLRGPSRLRGPCSHRGPERGRAAPLRLRGQAGQIGGIEVLPLGMLFFVAGTLFFASAWAVLDTKLAVSTAAQQGARAYSESDNERSANQAARRSAQSALNAYGRKTNLTNVEIAVMPTFRRCARVEVTVSYRQPTIAVPFLGGFGGTQVVSSTFSEIIDPYRSRLSGAAQCS